METWKPVVDYEGYYEVSDAGNVRSVDRIVTRSDGVRQLRRGRMCNQHINQDGYAIVNLSKDGYRRKCFVHRLVYAAFVGCIRSGDDVDHKDFTRTNNCVENLQALSHGDNVARTVAAKRNYTSIRDTHGSGNPNFGNRKLSQKYAANATLAREKQSRPGGQNGRACGIIINLPDGTEMSFSYIGECAEYLSASGLVRNKTARNALCISRAAKAGSLYHGIAARFI